MGKLFNSPRQADSAYAVAEEMRPFVATGAILIRANQWTPQTLVINPSSKIEPRQVLQGFWDVKNKEEALGLIDAFLTDGNHLELDPLLEKYLAGDNRFLNAEQTAMLKYVSESIMVGYKWNGVKLKIGDIDSVRTTIAWDIERAAFIARLAFNCGYISEDETWDTLKATRNLAELNFKSWRDYLISFMKGRALIMTDESYMSGMDQMFANGLLLNDLKWGDVWAWSPLTDS
ncbi:MAG: DUF1266 domain-containing protein [Deferribacteraceae bacterium]|jgi:hypothetical protein|nr:DUF1266 domain-containing protein [Deferribacteraceae bacterium]